MCGIAGLTGSLASKENMATMLKQQKHRGPDAQAMWIGDNLILGHNRLSIIDLSDMANQPMVSHNGRFVLIFNGEIYNYIELKKELSDYPFKTHSDTEVLLAGYQCWGEKVLNKLNGMFAFAVYDCWEKSLFLARDRYGIKPLYYYEDRDALAFASEIATLFTIGIPQKPNETVWSNYLQFGSYGRPDETFWNDIQTLPGGFCMTYQNGEKEIKQWYYFEDRVAQIPEDKSTVEQEEYIEYLLNNAVKLRFRADVPVGFNLSGGLDSSMLLALINRQFKENDGIQAFTFYTQDDRYDELPWVEQMLKNMRFPLNRCLLKAEEVAEEFRQMSALQMEPYGGLPTLAYSLIFKTAREKGVTVLLDGQGSDEAWAGYDYYLKKKDAVIQGVKKSPFRKKVLSEDFLQLGQKPDYPRPFDNKLQNLQYRDLFYTKIPRALRFNDLASMRYSAELRTPFLDYRLVEYVFSRPENFKIKNGAQKWFLRQLATKYLAKKQALAPKRPLQTPQREWLSDDLKNWVGDLVLSLRQHPWFKKKELEKELDGFFGGDNQSSFHVWQWMSAGELLLKK